MDNFETLFQSKNGDWKKELEMLITRQNACWAAVCGVFACAATESSALEASDLLVFNAGPVSLRPQLNIDGQYNDNLFYRDSNQVQDFVTMISPADGAGPYTPAQPSRRE